MRLRGLRRHRAPRGLILREAPQDRLHKDEHLVQLGARLATVDEEVAAVREAREPKELAALREDILVRRSEGVGL